MIFDEDMILQDICFLSSVDIQDDNINFSHSYATKFLNISAYVLDDATVGYTHPYRLSDKI